MGSKLLIIFVIITAHGALAVGWAKQELPQPRAAVTACVNSPGALPDFTPRRMLFAEVVPHPANEEVMQP